MDEDLASGDIFLEAAWPPLGTRVSIVQLATLRQSFIGPLNSVGFPHTPPPTAAGQADLVAAKAFWIGLCGSISEGAASDGEMWRWLALRFLPDAVAWRWQRTTDKRSRFLGSGTSLRCWPMSLWWYAWSCADEDGVLNEELLKAFASTDMRVALLERGGEGFDRPLIQAIIRHARGLKSDREKLVRGAMRRLTWIRGSHQTAYLSEGDRVDLVNEIIAWALKNYCGD